MCLTQENEICRWKKGGSSANSQLYAVCRSGEWHLCTRGTTKAKEILTKISSLLFFSLVFFFTVLSTCYTMSWTQRAILTSKNQGANLGSVLGYRRSFLEDDYDSMLTGPLIKRGSSKRIARLNSQLVGWEDLPQWMRCKSHMTSGHRSSSTFACLRCFASLFHIHNSRGITVRERQRC